MPYKDKEKRNECLRRWKRSNSEKVKKYAKEYKQRSYVKQRERDARYKKVLKQFNWTLNDYYKQLDMQNNCCAICGKNLDYLKRRPPLDHCHKTGKVRRILCPHCNISLAWYENKKDIIDNYIKEFQNDSSSGDETNTDNNY